MELALLNTALAALGCLTLCATVVVALFKSWG
jgi:hypothetical protein